MLFAPTDSWAFTVWPRLNTMAVQMKPEVPRGGSLPSVRSSRRSLAFIQFGLERIRLRHAFDTCRELALVGIVRIWTDSWEG